MPHPQQNLSVQRSKEEARGSSLKLQENSQISGHPLPAGHRSKAAQVGDGARTSSRACSAPCQRSCRHGPAPGLCRLAWAQGEKDTAAAQREEEEWSGAVFYRESVA